MTEETYFQIVNWLVLINTVPVLFFGCLCFVWTSIARTAWKKTIFAAFGGAMFLFCAIRILVGTALTDNHEMLLVIGVLQGVIMSFGTIMFTIATVIVIMRTRELDRLKNFDASTTVVEKLDKAHTIGTEIGSMMRRHGWC